MGGLPASSSLREPGASFVPLGHSTSSGDWATEVGMVEDGWIVIKGKKSRPPSHPSQIYLQSSKNKSKGKI